jgi:hypothetical protein
MSGAELSFLTHNRGSTTNHGRHCRELPMIHINFRLVCADLVCFYLSLPVTCGYTGRASLLSNMTKVLPSEFLEEVRREGHELGDWRSDEPARRQEYRKKCSQKGHRDTRDPLMESLMPGSGYERWLERAISSRIGHLWQRLLGHLPGISDLGPCHPTGLDLHNMNDGRWAFVELKNKTSTTNSGSREKVHDRLDEAVGDNGGKGEIWFMRGSNGVTEQHGHRCLVGDAIFVELGYPPGSLVVIDGMLIEASNRARKL